VEATRKVQFLTKTVEEDRRTVEEEESDGKAG